jgi:hypothetical protein
MLTYAYYSKVQNRFDSISNIMIDDVVAHQFIGKHDVIGDIEDIRTKIHSTYWIRCLLREICKGYKDSNGDFYANAACTVPIIWDDYVLYYITDLSG